MSVVVAIVLWAISALLLIGGGALAEEGRAGSSSYSMLIGFVIGACALWVIA